MFTSEFVVKNPTGLHARPASQLAQAVQGYSG